MKRADYSVIDALNVLNTICKRLKSANVGQNLYKRERMMGNNIEQHKNILDGIHDTYVRKNNDYGNSFTRSFEKYGITASMVRMEDKWNRLESLASGKKQMVNDESIKEKFT